MEYLLQVCKMYFYAYVSHTNNNNKTNLKKKFNYWILKVISL